MAGRRPTDRGLLRSCVGGLLALGAAALIACREEPADPAVLVDEVTFESGAEARVSLQAAAEDALRVVTSPVRGGDHAGMAILREGDDQFRGDLGFRSEWQSSFKATTGVDYWYGISVYMPDDWHQGDNPNTFDDRIIFQFHEGTGSSPALSLHIRSGEQHLQVRRRAEGGRFDYLWSMPFETRRWYDIAFQIRWSQDDDGRVQIFVDRQLVHHYEGPTLVDGTSTYPKWGIYGQPTRVFIDEVRIAEGRAGGLSLVSPD